MFGGMTVGGDTELPCTVDMRPPGRIDVRLVFLLSLSEESCRIMPPGRMLSRRGPGLNLLWAAAATGVMDISANDFRGEGCDERGELHARLY